MLVEEGVGGNGGECWRQCWQVLDTVKSVGMSIIGRCWYERHIFVTMEHSNSNKKCWQKQKALEETNKKQLQFVVKNVGSVGKKADQNTA